MAEQERLDEDPGRQDLYSGRRIAWRWVLVGALIVLGTETLFASTVAAIGGRVTEPWTFVLGTTVAFLVGGFVIGLLSPGWTIWEAGYAGVIAVAWTGFLLARLLDSGFLATLPLGLAWGLLCGLAGGWIGERLQHRP